MVPRSMQVKKRVACLDILFLKLRVNEWHVLCSIITSPPANRVKAIELENKISAFLCVPKFAIRHHVPRMTPPPPRPWNTTSSIALTKPS